MNVISCANPAEARSNWATGGPPSPAAASSTRPPVLAGIVPDPALPAQGRSLAHRGGGVLAGCAPGNSYTFFESLQCAGKARQACGARVLSCDFSRPPFLSEFCAKLARWPLDGVALRVWGPRPAMPESRGQPPQHHV